MHSTDCAPTLVPRKPHRYGPSVRPAGLVIGAELNLLGSELRHRVYATHFIFSFLRFFAQSTR